MQSFPHFLRGQPSPKVQDSAFPPFKVEHRYKGVYERAGFEVNMNSTKKPSPTDAKSFHSVRSNQNNHHAHINHPNGIQSPSDSASTSPTSVKQQSLKSGSAEQLTSNLNQHGSHPKQLSSNPYDAPTSAKSATFGHLKAMPYPMSPPLTSNRSYSESQIAISKGSTVYQRSFSESKATSQGIDSNGVDLQSQVPTPIEPFKPVSPNKNYQKNYKNLRLNLDHGPEPGNEENEGTQKIYDSDSENEMNNTISPKENSFDETRSTSIDKSEFNDLNSTSMTNISAIPSRKEELAQKPPLHDISNQYPTHDYSNQQMPQMNSRVPNNIGYPHQAHQTSQSHIPRVDHNAYGLPSPSNPIQQQVYGMPPLNQNQTYGMPQVNQNQHRPAPQPFQPNHHHQRPPQRPNFQHHHHHQQQKERELTHQPTIPEFKIDAPDANFSLPQSDSTYRLSNALDEFKKDIQAHKDYVPRSPSIPNTPPDLPASSPTELGLTRFEKQVSNPKYGTNTETFQEPPYPVNELLVGSSPKEARLSQLSMVSSIISKESHYNDEEEDEVEKELKRQLDMLKQNGGSEFFEKDQSSITSSIDQDQIDQEDNLPHIDIEEDLNEEPDHEIMIPQVQSAPCQNEKRSSDSSNNSVDLDDMSSTASYDSVKPLSVRHSANVSFNTIELPPSPVKFRKEVKFTDVDSFVSPVRSKFPTTISEQIFNTSSPSPTSPSPRHMGESVEEQQPPPSMKLEDEVKPLSPKNHEIEKELQGLNFEIQQATESPSQFMINENSELITNEPFKADIAQEENIQEEEAEQTYHVIVPPGSGPCRSCRNPILSNAKGSQRAIYSKTGELSGQWHRGCFKCAYDDCEVAFSKNVQCYALHNQPYCFSHYHQLNNTTCEGCSIGIEGDCIENELEQKWHLHCLTCHKCNNIIQADYFLINGKIVCDSDAQILINTNNQTGLSSTDKIEKRRTRLLFLD